jgi:hypothetical protein
VPSALGRSGLDQSVSLARSVKQWASENESIWLPNFFEGKDPFDGKQTDAKGLPAGGTDKRGSTVLPTTKAAKIEDDSEF